MSQKYKKMVLPVGIIFLILLAAGIYARINNKPSPLPQHNEPIAQKQSAVDPPAQINKAPDAAAQTAQAAKLLLWRKAYDCNGINAVAYGNGVYAAAGNNGVVKTSPDGENWYLSDSGQQDSIRAVVWGSDKFVAVGKSILVSADGRKWNTAETGSIQTVDFDDVKWNGSVFVTAGPGGIATSADGITWTSRTFPETPTVTARIATNGSRFVIASTYGTGILISDDGVAWNKVQIEEGYGSYHNLAYSGKIFAVWARYGVGSEYDKNAVFISADGQNWTKHFNNLYFSGITADGQKFVAIGDEFPNVYRYTSENGADWEKTQLASATFLHDSLGDLFWLNNRFIKSRAYGEIYTSTNALDWRLTNSHADSPFSGVENTGSGLTLPADTLAQYRQSENVVNNGQVYVNVGGGGYPGSMESGMEGYHYSIVYTSPDGENWTQQTYQNNSVLYKAAWGNGKFVAVGSNGVILTSPDGITPWTQIRSKKGYNLSDIIWDGTRFVTAGAEVLYSQDGVNWTDANVSGVARLLWNDEEYIALGYYSIYTAVRPKVFSDMENHWAKTYVDTMAARGIIKGVAQNSFAPERDITRAEFAALIVRALDLKASGSENPFADIKTTDWFYQSVCAAAENGIITGYGDGIIKPDTPITRQEAMTMIARAMKLLVIDTALSEAETSDIISAFSDNGAVAGWAVQSVAACIKNGVVQGSEDKLMPYGNISRAETATIIWRVIEKNSGIIE
ncbi:MAG: Endo-1,4-beta-xylanase A precursor [Firmicutes bacterium ADurb.Bin193]|nr:MAG: Endo-1,4-beta-xylanase A precursor [Firmicutes bacterium ADurb.Bin193]